MDLLAVLVFAATYLGMALGRVPGLRLDRTGIALMAAVLFLAVGRVTVEGVGRAIDAPTLLLLFALMIVSAQFQAAGFYRYAAERVTAAQGGALRLLALTVAVAGGLSALLANDIVVFAMAPILARGARDRGLDPRPFLIALAGAANAGSAITVIGNPQNILIGQAGGLGFLHFLLVCGPPGMLALVIVFAVVRVTWRDALSLPAPQAAASPAPPDTTQTAKGGLAILALVAVFLSPLPREVGALAVASLLLASRRMSSRDMIGAVDWHLLVLFASLFVVTAAFSATGLSDAGAAWLAAHGLLPERVSVMAPLMLAASNGIGNVPAVILLLSVWPDLDAGTLYGVALLSTLAGNLFIVGSLANIIVVERAAAAGVRLGFIDHARSGVPMTIISVAAAALWLLATGQMRP